MASWLALAVNIWVKSLICVFKLDSDRHESQTGMNLCPNKSEYWTDFGKKQTKKKH